MPYSESHVSVKSHAREDSREIYIAGSPTSQRQGKYAGGYVVRVFTLLASSKKRGTAKACYSLMNSRKESNFMLNLCLYSQ